MKVLRRWRIFSKKEDFRTSTKRPHKLKRTLS